MFDFVKSTDKKIYDSIIAEYKRQSDSIELIASENYQSPAVLQAQASPFANKYSEGTPGRRYYAGQENTDTIEQLAIDRAKEIFKSDHANVQALSGAAANICVYAGLLQPSDGILGMSLSHGGHLTHGAPVTFISNIFSFYNYGTKANGEINFDQIRELAHKHKPKMILAGFSAYPRELDYAKFVEIAQEIGAVAYADVSHIGGFIAAGLLKNPMDHGFHAMMTTTHKSLRGPRGAIILSKGIVSNPLQKPENTIENIPTRIDRAVFPGIQGGPHMNTIAAIAVALQEVQTSEFKNYAKQTLDNTQILAQEFLARDYKLLTGGTDNHMIILDFQGTELDGAIAANTLEKIGISTSKSTIPDDPNPPFKPSGLRLGMPAMTTRGAKESDVKKIVEFIDLALKNYDKPDLLQKLKAEVQDFSKSFPVPTI